MKLPVPIEHPAYEIETTAKIVDLMDLCEEEFEKLSEKAGEPLELQINVLWNTKDHKKALNPNDTIGAHFVDGETFGVYGDIQPALTRTVKKEEDKTPVTVLTGFLGSGKTTLLNYILKEQREKKIAVIENEFGEIPIDDALLQQSKIDLAEQVITMDNGCMCCTIRGDLTKGLGQIRDRMRQGNHIDAIIIETTGMADPVPIVRTFMSDPELTMDLRLDGVITMADSKHLEARLDDNIEEGKVNEAYQQIAFADKIILNKLDLIETDQAIRCKDRIRDINRYAKILPAVKGRVKLEELSNIRGHDMAHFAEIDIAAEATVDKELGGHGHGGHGGHEGGHDENCTEDHGSGGHGGHDGHGSGHGSGHGGHGGGGGHGSAHGQGHGGGHGHGSTASRHDGRVSSFGVVKEGEITPQKLGAWMGSIGQLPPEKGTIFRIKAILAVKGHPFKHVFHAVMDVSDEDDAGPWEEGEKKISKIVFIGKNLDQKFLREGFESIFEQ